MALDPELLRPSGAILAADIAVGSAIRRDAVDATGHDATTLDLLVRLDLAPDHTLRAVELCRQLQLSASHVSRRLDHAEAVGLVVRRPDPSDRRASLVSLTEAGRQVVADFAPRLHAVLDRIIFDHLDGEEIDTLVELLARIERAAATALPDG